MNILIRGSRVVDPVTGTDEVKDIYIENGLISAVGTEAGDRAALASREDLRVIEGEGLVTAPGLMDAHVHFRDPGQTWKEDIETGAAAAAHGGFTTVVCMANTIPAVDNPEVLNMNLEKGQKTGIRMLQASTVTQGMMGEKLVDMEAMKNAGAAGFTDDGKPIMDEKLLLEACREAARLDLPISLHEEDPLFIHGAGVNAGPIAEKLGYGGAEAAAEDVLTARDCMIALETGAPMVIQHISSKGAVEAVRMAKKLGAQVYAEATPHHFTLTEDDVLKYGTNARMNPPLRTAEDRSGIIEGLKDGTIDMIVTDHAPHSTEEKAKAMDKAPSGITGLETSLSLGILSLVEPGHLTLLQLIDKMSTAPAKIYRRKPVSIAPGNEADLVIFGEKERYTVSWYASKSRNTPFTGWELPGKVHMTICGGKIIYED